MSMTRIPVARERLRSPSPGAPPAGILNSRHGSPGVSGLEASLLQLIHNHQLASFHLREQTGSYHYELSIFSRSHSFALINIGQRRPFLSSVLRNIIKPERAKKEAVEAAARVSEVVVEAVNGGVQESFINEKRIELEIRAVAAAVFRYKKETDHWIAASRAINTAIKEIGDFENWMKIVEYDCRSITLAIHNIHHHS